MEEPKYDFLCSMFALAVVTKRHWKPHTQTHTSFQRLIAFYLTLLRLCGVHTFKTGHPKTAKFIPTQFCNGYSLYTRQFIYTKKKDNKKKAAFNHCL